MSFKRGGLVVKSHAWDRNFGGRDLDEALFNHFCAGGPPGCRWRGSPARGCPRRRAVWLLHRRSPAPTAPACPPGAEFQASHKMDVRANAKASFKLRTQCEKLKKILSANPEVRGAAPRRRCAGAAALPLPRAALGGAAGPGGRAALR